MPLFTILNFSSDQTNTPRFSTNLIISGLLKLRITRVSYTRNSPALLERMPVADRAAIAAAAAAV